MPKIFEEMRLGSIVLANRFVRSATWEGLANSDGEVTAPLLDIYEQLAQGQVGLIISSYMYVQKNGKQNIGQLGIQDDNLIPGLRHLADTVHNNGGKVVGQIVHCGGQANRKMTGRTPVAPSAVESPGYREMPRSLSAAEIGCIVNDFRAAAGRLEQAGFDGVQLHGAHGYLLSQFLSPIRNKRSDDYGGSLENRSRFTLEVYRAIRQEVGPDFPVMIKLNVNDFLDGSTTEIDSCHLAMALWEEGLDAIEVSGGTPGSGKLGATRKDIEAPADEAYFLPQARAVRRAVPGLPLMLVGGLRSLEVMEAILQAGQADFLSLSRPLIREPDLPSRWLAGEHRRAACISCGGCFKPALRGEGIRCVQRNR